VLFNFDGPLHALPAGALVRELPTGSPQYFVEWKPSHTTPSMTVYAEGRKTRPASARSGTVVAFGDPVYAKKEAATLDAEQEFLLRSGNTLNPLPATRREVGAIAKLFGPNAVTYLGDAATESRATFVDRSARYVHFAVHGVLNEYLPLNSALAFSTPAAAGVGDNGLLQAWEVFEKMRIDADLVTLSACESGLGKVIAGEGLVGLTRAFLFAGARTVNASLWKVADGPTADLMTHFYRNLRRGDSKDEALRQAQIAVMKMGRRDRIDYSSPAHWAAFVLTGDWK